MQKQQALSMSMSMSNPPDNHTSSLETEDTNHHDTLMAKVLDAVMERVHRNYPAAKSADDLRERTKKQLNKLLPTLHTPDHPPYALMIRRAIKELNEAGGSSEEAISKFMKAEYKELPWGHSSLLKHHLKKLEEAKEIICAPGNCYVLPPNCNSHATPEQKWIPNKRFCQMEGRDSKQNPYRGYDLKKSHNVAVQESERVDAKNKVVNKKEHILFPYKAIVAKHYSKQNEPGIKMVSGQEKGSDIGDGGKVNNLENDKMKNHMEMEEVETASIGEENRDGHCKVERLKERKEEDLHAIGEGKRGDRPVDILEKDPSRKLNTEPNGQKVLACQQNDLVFGQCEGVPKENLKHCQQISNPVTKCRMDEKQGMIVEKETKERDQKCKLVGDSNLAGNDNKFIENTDQVQEEQQPAAIIQKDKRQDGQQIHMVELTECYRHFEMAEQSKPSEKQENQVTCQVLMKPIDVIMGENLADGKRKADAIEEVVGGEMKEDRSLLECHSESKQGLVPFGLQREGRKQMADAIGPHLQKKQMVIEKTGSNIGSLVQQNGSIRQEVWEQEHQFKATNKATFPRKLEDDLLEEQGGQETISNGSKPLFASPDLGSYGSLHPRKEECFEFLKKTIRLQKEFSERTIRIQEEYNKKIVSLQEELVMQLALGWSSAHPLDHAIFNSMQNAGLRDSAGLLQQPEVSVQGKGPVMHKIENLSYADVPMHQLHVNAEQLSVSNSKRLAEGSPSVPENLSQRRGKRQRVSEQQDLMGKESNLHGFPNAMAASLKQFQRNIFNALGGSPEAKLGRLKNSQQRQVDAQLNASPKILMSSIRPCLCQIGKEPLREVSTEGHSIDLVPKTLKPCHVLLEEQGQQHHKKKTCQGQGSKLELMILHQQTQQQQLHPQVPKLDKSVASTHSTDFRASAHPSTSEHHQHLSQLEESILGNSGGLDMREKVGINAQPQQQMTMSHQLLDNLNIVMGQPGRAQGMIKTHPQWQQQFDMQVSGKELCSQVNTPIVASDISRNYALPWLSDSFIISFGNTPYQPPTSKSHINRTIVQALPNFQSYQQWQESFGGVRGRGRGQGRGRGRRGAMQKLASVTTFEQGTLPSQSAPKPQRKPHKIKHVMTDVVASS